MDKLLTPAEVADIIGVDPQLLADWRHRKVGPPFLKLGHRTVRYDAKAVERWFRAHTTHTNGSQP